MLQLYLTHSNTMSYKIDEEIQDITLHIQINQFIFTKNATHVNKLLMYYGILLERQSK